MKNLETHENEFVDDILYELNDIDKDRALEVLQDISLEWIHDAEKVKKEINRFVVVSGETYSLNIDECPYFAQVWSGDFYDKEELEGLKALYDDLLNQSKRISEESLVEEALAVLAED